MSISVRRRRILEEDTNVNLKITEAKQEDSRYGEQIGLKFKIIDGPHAGHELMDWVKIQKDEDTGELYVREGTKTWELLVAADGEDGAEKFTDPRTLVGKKITARVDIRGKTRKRNGLRFGTIGPFLVSRTEENEGVED